MQRQSYTNKLLVALVAVSLLVLLSYYTSVRLGVTLLFMIPALYVAWRYRVTGGFVFRGSLSRATFVLVASAIVTLPFYKELDAVIDRFGVSGDHAWMVYLGYYLLSLPFLAMMYRQATTMDDNRTLSSCDRMMDARWFWWLCLAMGIAAIGVQIVCSFTDTLWNDEVFTLRLISHDYAEMTRLGAADVHPMLYYYITKFVVELLTQPGIGIELIAAAKLASVLPFVLMLVILATVVRTRMGRWVSAVSILGMFALSGMIWQGVEIRMYSWSALWVTAACVSLYCVLCRATVLNMACFVLSGVASACTHHFAALAYGGLLVAWGLWALFWSDNRWRELLRYVVCVIAFVLLYMPQLLVSITQFGDVTGHDYWIEPIDGLTILSYMYNLLGNSLTGAVIVSVAVVAIAIWRHMMRVSAQRPRVYMAIVAFALPLWVATCGIGVSLALRPVFVFRYLYPVIPSMAIGIALIASLSGSVRLMLWHTCVLMSVFVMIAVSFFKTERQGQADLSDLQELYDRYPGACFVSDNIWTLWELGVDINTRQWYVWQDDLIDNERKIYGIGAERMIDDAQQLMRLADECPGALLFVKNDNPDSLLDHSRYEAVEVGRNTTNTVIYEIAPINR